MKDADLKDLPLFKEIRADNERQRKEIRRIRECMDLWRDKYYHLLGYIIENHPDCITNYKPMSVEDGL